MGNKRPREEDSSSEDKMDDALMLASCERSTVRRSPMQESRYSSTTVNYRRRHRLTVRRIKRRRHSSGNSTSGKGGICEETADRLPFRRYKHVGMTFSRIKPRVTPRVMPSPASEDNKPWYQITWQEITYAALSVVILIIFLETHIETWITGRPPYRFRCYLCGLVLCWAVWCFLVM